MYNILGIHFTRWAWLCAPLALFMRVKVYPESRTKESFTANLSGKAVVYVLPRMSIMDTIVLNKTLKSLGQKKSQRKQNQKGFVMQLLWQLSLVLYYFQTHKKITF